MRLPLIKVCEQARALLFAPVHREGRGSLALLCVAALLGTACEGGSPEPARILSVSVFDEDDLALAGVPVELDGIAAIKTGQDGTARISLSRTGPARARIGVRCAAGSREVAPRYISRAATGTRARLELSFTCRPQQRKVLIVVRAPGAQGALVRADGEALGRVEPDGTLHAALWRQPESDLRLLIDTRGLPITPQNPAREVRVADRDELVVFDQAFAAHRVPGRLRSAPGARRHAPPDTSWPSGDGIR